MPRRSELLEEERNYRLVKREKEESGALVKQALRVLFSQVGVVILGVITAVLGNVHLISDQFGSFMFGNSKAPSMFFTNNYAPIIGMGILVTAPS